MSAYTDADLQAVALAAFSFEQCDRRQQADVQDNWDARLNERDQQEYRGLARAVLDAVVPAIVARAKAEALREFASTMLSPTSDSLGRYPTDGGTCRHFANIARDRADEIERHP